MPASPPPPHAGTGSRAENPLRKAATGGQAASGFDVDVTDTGGGGVGGVSRSVSPPGGPAAAGSGFDDPWLMSWLCRAPAGDRASLGYGADWSPHLATHTPVGAAAGSASGHAAGGVSHEMQVSAEAFFACMAVCHTVVPETNDADPTGPAIYQAESPDEGALTKAARDLGFEFVQRTADGIVVRRKNGGAATDLPFRIYGVHEFNSTRKRMSVVASGPDGRYLIMVKGADNVIFERAHVEPTRATLEAHLTRFASDGLRTLVLAQRELSPAEFEAWRAAHHAASVALTKREERLAEVAEAFEKGLHVLGATAIEDRLQVRSLPSWRDWGGGCCRAAVLPCLLLPPIQPRCAVAQRPDRSCRIRAHTLRPLPPTRPPARPPARARAGRRAGHHP
jgi:hypothetical protein